MSSQDFLIGCLNQNMTTSPNFTTHSLYIETDADQIKSLVHEMKGSSIAITLEWQELVPSSAVFVSALKETKSLNIAYGAKGSEQTRIISASVCKTYIFSGLL